jgi:hypothetical protein
MIIIRKNTHCKKCNIELCEKNEFLSYGGQGMKKGCKYRHTTCKHCVKNYNSCRIKYDDPVLNELCKKQGVYLYNKLYVKKHKSTILMNARKTKYKRRSELTDNIVIHDLIYSHGIIRKLGRPLKKEEITPIMIDVKRKSILLTRKLKEQGYE